jgi:hypothetical protein
MRGLKTGIGLMSLMVASPALAEDVSLFDGKRVANIVSESEKPLTLAATMLAGDLEALSGQAPKISTHLKDCGAVCVVIGTHNSPLVKAVSARAKIDTHALKGQWERYGRAVVKTPHQTIVLIYGSDPRGAIYGVVDLTRALGVSAWEWWADVTPRHADSLKIDGDAFISETPSVKYRGIFLNDEDWGLQPWAAKTFDPKQGDIGPKTYAKIYQLMWRLKANILWPAMHDVTKPFYQIAGNPEMARDYAIVVGTSHAEPMMRNNVREWDVKKRGDFNYFTNRDQLIDYWRTRVTEAKGFENIYSVGLRGVHDSAMEGAKTTEQARDGVNDVIKDQRDLLSQALKQKPDTIPQVLTLYKEVLEVYQAGLKVPDDVTLIWPEDNYGYINQLSTPEEARRSGGTGVYYHLSYWGRPHDYLWLATTHPALIREQMQRAYATGSKQIWIANVGDIKPGEYLTQYFLDLAFDAKTFQQDAKSHLTAWAKAQFGAEAAPEIADIMTGYYDLAFARRPEFMGWSQTEPTTQTQTSSYIGADGFEAQARLEVYDNLTKRAEALAAKLPADKQAAFFELVLYPVRSASNLNARILKLDLAALYARQGRAATASALSDQARAAQAQIRADTETYNGQLSGKWRYMMDIAPRRLPVFNEPLYPQYSPSADKGCAIAQEGARLIKGKGAVTLDVTQGQPQTQRLELFSYQPQPVPWKATATNPSVTLASDGTLEAANGYQKRLSLKYDGTASKGDIIVNCGGGDFRIRLNVQRAAASGVMATEVARVVTIPAAAITSQSSISQDWEIIPGLGSQGSALRAKLDGKPTGFVSYAFEARTGAVATLKLIGVPVHALNSDTGVKVAVSIDDGPRSVLDLETFGRSDEWKQNVLSNTAVREIEGLNLKPGMHTLKLYAIDPGVIIDRFEVRFDGATPRYGAMKN